MQNPFLLCYINFQKFDPQLISTKMAIQKKYIGWFLFGFLFFLIITYIMCSFVYCCWNNNSNDDDDDDDNDDDDDDDDDDRGDYTELEEVLSLTPEALEKIPEWSYEGGDSDELECAICFEPFADGDSCRFLQGCGHFFHKLCVDKWLIKKPNCPICTATIVLGDEGIDWMV